MPPRQLVLVTDPVSGHRGEHVIQPGLSKYLQNFSELSDKTACFSFWSHTKKCHSQYAYSHIADVMEKLVSETKSANKRQAKKRDRIFIQLDPFILRPHPPSSSEYLTCSLSSFSSSYLLPPDTCSFPRISFTSPNLVMYLENKKLLRFPQTSSPHLPSQHQIQMILLASLSNVYF